MANNTVDIDTLELLKTGTLIDFKILKNEVVPCTDPREAHSVAKLLILDDDEEDGYQSVEWGAFGFIYVIATLSFHDARPRNSSEEDYKKDDSFSVSEMVNCLQFSNNRLRFYCDYHKGRLVKTEITIQLNGEVEIKTTCRGNALEIWLQKLQGKKTIKLV